MGKICPKSHLDIVTLVKYVRDHRQKTFAECQQTLLSGTSPPSWLVSRWLDAASHALRFGASLWLFVETIDWNDNESLNGFVERKAGTLARRNGILAVDSSLHFNARMLIRIAGMELVWTSNVMDHLRLDLEDPTTPQLFLFRYASFLSSHRDVEAAGVFPDRFFSEIAETIALLFLFPFAETNQKRWQKRIRRKADLDVEAAISCNTSRNLDHYHFWHDRLALIQLTFDQSKPDSMKQWWCDKRDSDKFYTYWYAVVAILFDVDLWACAEYYRNDAGDKGVIALGFQVVSSKRKEGMGFVPSIVRSSDRTEA